ncbi:shikimate 5-dehydrogenase [Synechococcus sp. PCC 7502]|uniref:shikimate dehydrogenase n=1 Tax=Synechococcus sp. PCC 7502 TaxID=1173263 RepID=UPI00029FC576|nr:shikimate dehydrogenase [Synechococcus sp. PCC 7502]AFY72937.1 shikimate 5-dehydrogenase [Synechococcus sp. PCC 7502]
MTVVGTTKILGIIGDPVSHSLSPVMHNAAIAAIGLDYVYIPLPVKIENLAIAFKGLGAITSVLGFNLTIPHKQEIIPLLDEITEVARAVGAVNTVKRTERGWIGTNTDVHGFLVPLQILDRDWQSIPVVILGNGGAAKAVVAGCLKLGCPVVHVIGRDQLKLREFRRAMTEQLQVDDLRVHTWHDLEHLLPSAGLVVNSTPIGMGHDLGSPLTASQLGLIPQGAIAYDLIYTPRPTKFLQMSEAQGLVTIDGLKMLLHQGAIALEFWIEKPAPIAVMAEALGL